MTNTANRLVGLIPRTMLVGLGKAKVFYPKSRIVNMDNFASDPRKSRSHQRNPKLSILPEEIDDDNVDI